MAKSGRNSMVECQLPKLKVASSSLVARSSTGFLDLFKQIQSELQEKSLRDFTFCKMVLVS